MQDYGDDVADSDVEGEDFGCPEGTAGLSPEPSEGYREGHLKDRSVKGLHHHFTGLSTIFRENPLPNSLRWETVLTWLPAVRGRLLSDDMADIFKRALDHETGVRLFAAYDLAIFQTRFWVILYDNHMCAKHVMEMNREQGLIWQRKLKDKLETSTQTRRSGDRIRKAMTPKEPPKYLWLN